MLIGGHVIVATPRTWDGNSVNQAIARAMKDLETQTIPESLVEQGGLAKDEVAYKKMVSPYDSRKYVEEVENSGPLLDELDVEKEDRMSPVNSFNQERRLVEEFIQESPPVEPEDIKSYEEVIIPVEETANDITEEKPTDPVVEDATSVVEEEEKAPVEAEVTPDVDVEEEASSSVEEFTVPVEEQVTAATETDIIVPVMAELVAPVEEVLVIAEEEQDKATVEETLVVETDAEEDCSIVDVKEDTNVQEISAPLEEEISLTTVEATKESVAVPLPTEDVPSTLPEEDQVIIQTSEETDLIEETQNTDIEEKEKIEEESVPIVKADTDRGSIFTSHQRYSEMREGNWMCTDSDCNNIYWSRSLHCYRDGCYEVQPGAWNCKDCANLNSKDNNSCYSCKHRTGMRARKCESFHERSLAKDAKLEKQRQTFNKIHEDVNRNELEQRSNSFFLVWHVITMKCLRKLWT